MTSCTHLREGAVVPTVREPATVEVVGVLAAYHSSMRLPTGQLVFTYTMDTNAVCCSESFLFYVLKPTKFMGRDFIVYDAEGPEVSHPERLFKPATRYCFRVQVTDLDSPLMGTSAIEPGVKEVPLSKEEANDCLAKLDHDEAFTKKQISQGKQKLTKTRLSAEDREAFEKWIQGYERDLHDIATKRKAIANLLNSAPTNYPDVYSLKRQELEAEGMKSIIRIQGIADMAEDAQNVDDKAAKQFPKQPQ